MSIVQDEKELEYWSDQKLLDEAQSPTGRMPLFLIHTQIEKRKNYRDSANARKQTPETTIYEEDVTEFGGGGLGSMPQQMPMSPPPTQQMTNSQMPPSNVQQPQMMSGGGKVYHAQSGGELENEANEIAAQGRYGDNMLVHMNPIEVAAMNRNGKLTVNPQTGLPEAWAFAPVMPWLAGAARTGLGYLGRGGAGLRSRLPTWLGGRAPITDPKRMLGHTPGTALQSRQQLVPRTPAWKRGLGGVWGSMKKHPIYWGLGGLGAFSGLRGLAGEDELPVVQGGQRGNQPLDAGTVKTPPPDITSLSKELYGTFLQPEGDYEKELSKAESYRRTPEQRKSEAQGMLYSGLAKALSNVGMEDIIEGVADVTPDVIALRKYQTEEERVVDKNIADLTRTRRGDKASAMQAAMEWEKVKNQKASYERSGELAIYDAAMKAWSSQMNYGMPGSIPFDIYVHFYRTGEWLGSGGGTGGAASQLQQNLPST